MPSNDRNRAPARHPQEAATTGGARSGLEQELTFLVRWLEALQRHHRYPLERAHYLMLLLLMEDGPQHIGRIAARLHLDSSTVTRQVAVMIERGLASRETSPQDRRCGLIRVTALGRKEATRMRRLREEKVEELVAGLSEPERQLLAEALGDLNDLFLRMLAGREQ